MVGNVSACMTFLCQVGKDQDPFTNIVTNDTASSSWGRLLLLEESLIVTCRDLHSLLWTNAEATILCPKVADLLPYRPLAVHLKELTAHPVTLPRPKGHRDAERELRVPLHHLLQ